MQIGEKDLARAVILQALKDASKENDSFVRKSARNFLCGVNDVWRESLKIWCDVGDMDYNDIIFFSRKRFGDGRTVKTS